MTDNDKQVPGADAPGVETHEAVPGQASEARAGGPTPAQQAAARGMYEDMHASTGGDSRVGAVTADQPEPYDDEAPVEGTVEDADAPAEGTVEDADGSQSDETVLEDAGDDAVPAPEALSPDAQLAAQRLDDLKRLNAEYINYKRRVDRDRGLESERAVAGMIESLLPVLDEIHLARQHGELEAGPFAKIAEKLETVLGRYGVERYGEPGETFDPNVHEAIIHVEAELAPGTTDTTVVQIMQPGYRIGDRVVRAALVSVADPA